MSRNIVICLFRNDLRLHDNEAFNWACSNGKLVIPLYCFDPRHFEKTHNFKFPKTGIHRCKFMIQSITDLRQRLQSCGSNLIVRHGTPEDVIAGLNDKLKSVSSIVFQREVTKEELDVEQAITEYARSSGNIHVEKIWGSTLYHIDDMPYEDIYQVHSIYTHFRNKVEKSCSVRKQKVFPSKVPPLPESIEGGSIPSPQDLSLAEIAEAKNNAFPFSGGETSGLERVNDYIWKSEKIVTYKETRNDLIGEAYSTKFSPWLAHGCVSPRHIFWEIKKFISEKKIKGDGPYWVIFELIWRDFFKYSALKYGNKFFFSQGIKTYTDETRKPEWKYDEDQFRAWAEGKTGIPFVDANMKELLVTGWMSNRGRQNVASFLARDLKLDWRLGAEWFESYLLDHDVCSNYGNWMWTSGVGGDPRGSYRKFNMIKQGIDYDPEGDFIKLWLPELRSLDKPSTHAPWCASPSQLKSYGVTLGKTYPKPIVIAPEWEKHVQNLKKGGSKAVSGKTRGIDFYFKSGTKSDVDTKT